MRLPAIVLTSLLVASNACAGWLTFGGKIHSDTTDTVTGVQSQQLVNVESGLTNEAVLRAQGDALALPRASLSGILATSTVARAGHADTATFATTAASATTAGKLTASDVADVWFEWDGSAWTAYRVCDSSNVCVTAVSGAGYDGPPVGARWFLSSTGDPTIYTNTANNPFNEVHYEVESGTWNIRTDGNVYSSLSAIGTLPQVLEKMIPDYDMTVTLDWLPQTNATALSTQADIDAALAAYPNATVVAGMITAALPAAGCTANGTGATLVITGAPPPIAWQAVPSGALAVSVAANAPRNRFYSITSIGKPVSSWPAGALVMTNSSGTSPFAYAIGPYTGALWQVVGGGR